MTAKQRAASRRNLAIARKRKGKGRSAIRVGPIGTLSPVRLADAIAVPKGKAGSTTRGSVAYVTGRLANGVAGPTGSKPPGRYRTDKAMEMRPRLQERIKRGPTAGKVVYGSLSSESYWGATMAVRAKYSRGR